MSRSAFWSIFLCLNLIFVFLKIYQHNLFVNALYEKQKLVSKENHLNLKINQLKSELFALRNHRVILASAKNKLNMQPLKVSSVHSIEQRSQHDT